MNTQHLNNMPQDWKAIADIFSALGDETRQKILLMFEPGEEVGRKAIGELLPLSQTAVAHHVATLMRAGLLHHEKRGKEVYYKLNHETLLGALNRVRDYVLELRVEPEQKS